VVAVALPVVVLEGLKDHIELLSLLGRFVKVLAVALLEERFWALHHLGEEERWRTLELVALWKDSDVNENIAWKVSPMPFMCS